MGMQSKKLGQKDKDIFLMQKAFSAPFFRSISKTSGFDGSFTVQKM
jgi:hypothetical protein